MKMLKTLLLAATCGVAACGSDGSPTSPSVGDANPSYSFSTVGERTESRSGISFYAFLTNGWREENNGGAAIYNSDVTLMSFATALDPTQPQTNIGLLGVVKPGVYHVRVAGTPFGTAPEFYASYQVVNTDGTSTVFSATSGTVTITSVSPTIRGTFSFHSGREARWPSNVTIGTTVTSQPASLDVTGEFVVKPR